VRSATVGAKTMTTRPMREMTARDIADGHRPEDSRTKSLRSLARTVKERSHGRPRSLPSEGGAGYAGAAARIATGMRSITTLVAAT
jgi:hypothetical protein